MFSIDGIVSGFDTSSIIEGLLQFQQTQLDIFNSRKAEISTRQSAFGGIEGQLLSLRSALGKLNRSTSVFDAASATSSNEEILTAVAGGDAANGTYSITVNALATAEQRGSQGFASRNAEIGTGSFTLQVGTQPATTIEIDESNNTLEGLADAINNQSDDVSAGIIFDQSTDEYRLLLTSSVTGAENTIDISADLTGGSNLDFSGEPIQVAANASVTLGSGAGAITSEYSSNQIDSLIEGVTLDLQSANSSQTVFLDVETDTGAIEEAISDFVEDFNSVIVFLDQQTAFDPETNRSSPLTGNRNVSRIRNDLINSVIESVPGLSAGLNRLADIGIDIGTNGQLELDSDQLREALNGEIEGVSTNDIRNLFGLNGQSSIPGIEFLLGSDNTVGNGQPFEVDIIQAAEQASITATNNITGTTTIDSSNNELTITVDGEKSETLIIPEGDYTAEELASTVESLINNSAELANRDVSVSLEDNGPSGQALVITTESYGSDSDVGKIGGTAASVLGFTGEETDTGVDVAGTFIVDGEVEVAVGRGRVLTGEADNANTADVQLLVTLSPSQITGDPEGEITITRGISSQLDLLLDDFLDADTGTISTINDEFDAQLESLDASIERINDVTEARREFLIAEFAALESILAGLQNTGNILTAQLSTLNTFRPN